jgi:hypothetical protein
MLRQAMASVVLHVSLVFELLLQQGYKSLRACS